MTRAVAVVLVFLAAGPLRAVAQEGAIPPHVAERLGIPPEKGRQVQELAFAANDELIGLEGAARRAQLALEREIRSASPEEAKIGALVDAVGRAEAAVRKNRIVLMLRVRKALGEELWQKLEAWRMENQPPPPPRPPGPSGSPPPSAMPPDRSR